MASLLQIRDAVKTTIEANITTLFGVYDNVPEAVEVPSVVVMPRTANFNLVMARGADQWFFDLFVLVSPADMVIGQESLDSYVTGAGSNSIRQCIHNNRTLGLASTDAIVSGMTAYNATFEAAGIDHIGAVLALTVTTAGTA